MRAGDEARTLFGREYADLDFVVHKRQSRQLRDLLETRGYLPERTFNAMHGAKRLLYHSPDNQFQVDVFLDVFDMCHRLDLKERLDVEDFTLPAAELLLTKLQIAKLNRKDVNDTLMLLFDHELSDSDGPFRLNASRLDELCGADWGLYTTINDNLDKVRDLVPECVNDDAVAAKLSASIENLQARLVAAPKTVGWKLRAQVGRRKKWYQLPEEVVR
ncbi:MAG: hypothetical protein ABSA65_14045 [Acidimicrobiales bacterium]